MVEELVSVIIPVYNAEKYVKQAIDSVKKQTYTNYEIIVIDDCSTDNSVSKIEGVDIFIKLKKNSGAAIARNKGIQVAKGEYIAFLDADDIWMENKLEEQVNFMKKNKIAFSFSSYYYLNNNNQKLKKVKVPKTLTYKEALKNTIITTITVMFSCKYLKKEDMYMPNIGSEDTRNLVENFKKGIYSLRNTRAFSNL